MRNTTLRITAQEPHDLSQNTITTQTEQYIEPKRYFVFENLNQNIRRLEQQTIKNRFRFMSSTDESEDMFYEFWIYSENWEKGFTVEGTEIKFVAQSQK